MKILKVGSKETLKSAIGAIKDGKVIICPTDTVYGLLADVTNKKAVEKIFRIKKRSTKKPLPIFVKDIKMAKEIAVINEKQENILKEKWPGKFTFVLEQKSHTKTSLVWGKEKTIGLRIPNYKLVLELLKKINRPLTGTSANISGKPASIKIKEVLKQFKDKKHKPDLVLDAGNLKPNKPSKVIDLTSQKPKILRR